MVLTEKKNKDHLKQDPTKEVQDIKLSSKDEADKKDIPGDRIGRKDSYLAVQLKSGRRIFIDNLLGGIAWGFGSVIGATIIVGILGLIVVETKKIPLLGSIVTVVETQIKTGANDLSNINK
jgi:hypothetical protein